MIINYYQKLLIRNIKIILKMLFNIQINKYDPELSSQTEKVFYNPISKETVISHTGTNFGSKKWYNDLRSDNAILWGLEKQDKRFKNAQSHLNKVKNKYGDNITVTGHSLGGSISEQLARSNPNVNSIAFNRGSGPWIHFNNLENDQKI